MYDHLTSPTTLGGMPLRNRIAMAAMGVEIAEKTGHAGEPIIAYYEQRARGGVGLIITEVCAAAYPTEPQRNVSWPFPATTISLAFAR